MVPRGTGTAAHATKTRTVVSSAAASAPAGEAVESEEPAPLVKEGDAEFEKLLAEEEAIEASTREHHETPHFRPGDGD